MKSRFKHFIALAVLLANGIASFGQQTTETDTTGKTGLEWWYEWWMKLDNQDNQGNYGQGGTYTLTLPLLPAVPNSIKINSVEYDKTCDGFKFSWRSKENPEYYRYFIKEENGSYIIKEFDTQWTSGAFKNLIPGKRYEVYIRGYSDLKVIEESDIYYLELPTATKKLKLSCEFATWGCNSSIRMILENAPASVKTVKWTCSDNLQCRYSGFNNTIKYAYFEIMGTGRAWIKATYTYNGKTYSAIYSRDIPSGLATPVIYAQHPSSGTYTPGQSYIFCVDNVRGATSYDWKLTQAGIDSWPNGEYGNIAKIRINSQPSSSSRICEFKIEVAAKNGCETGNYATFRDYVPRTASRMVRNNITDTVAIDNNLLPLSVDELNMESQESSFIVYPNPATTQLNITQTVSSNALSLTKDATIKTVDIFDVKGNKCASHVFNDAQTTATIDITDLANGTFVLVINKDSDNAWTCSFVKK